MLPNFLFTLTRLPLRENKRKICHLEKREGRAFSLHALSVLLCWKASLPSKRNREKWLEIRPYDEEKSPKDHGTTTEK